MSDDIETHNLKERLRGVENERDEALAVLMQIAARTDNAVILRLVGKFVEFNKFDWEVLRDGVSWNHSTWLNYIRGR